MLRLLIRSLALLGLGLLAFPAQAETRIAPYLEVQQVLDADLGDGDVLTYTSLAAGFDGRITTRRIEAQASYRYERRIPWDGELNDQDVHSGLARARIAVMPEVLAIEGGAIAIRTRSDIRGDGTGVVTSDSNNVTQVYGIYAGPSLSTKAGSLSVNADYRFGYVKAESDGAIRLGPAELPLDRYDRATSHDANARIGMAPGVLPFGWSVSGGYVRENASQLDQRYIGRYARGDIVLPVSGTTALTGGLGHERIRLSQRAALLDANGLPLLDGRGRFVTDPASPRLLAYDTSGLIWDVGVIWKPGRRTTLEARFGRRYGDYAFTATLDHQLGRRTGLRIRVFDAIDSFGRGLTRNLSGLPVRFQNIEDPLGGGFGGCVFGNEPGSGTCFSDVLQSVTAANYRTRGAIAMLSGEQGPWRYGVGATYVAHRFLAPRGQVGVSIDGLTDRSFGVQASADRRLSANSGLTGVAYTEWYRSGLSNGVETTEIGADVSYYRYLTEHLRGRVAVGLYTTRFEGRGSDTRGQLLLGLRYEI